MAVLPLSLVPDPVLRHRAKRVRNIDRTVVRLVEDMIDTMKANEGVGLAAPQIGISLRVIVIEIPGKDIVTLINPELVKRIGEREVSEGCLSIPGYRGVINRAQCVTAKGLDLSGRAVRFKATDLFAQALEHEVGHIQGALYTDLLASMDDLYKLEDADRE